MIRKLIYFGERDAIVEVNTWYILKDGLDEVRAEKVWEGMQKYYDPDQVPSPNYNVLQHFAGQLTQEEVDAFLWLWYFDGPGLVHTSYVDYCSAFSYFLFSDSIREDFSCIWREEMRVERLMKKEIGHVVAVVVKATKIAPNLATLIRWLKEKAKQKRESEAEKERQDLRAEIERLGLQEQFKRLLDGVDREILYELDPYDGYFGSLRNATHPEKVFLAWYFSKKES